VTDRRSALFNAVNRRLREQGIRLAPERSWTPQSSTHRPQRITKLRNVTPEMHQTAEGKQWYFGMKAHIGVDSR